VENEMRSVQFVRVKRLVVQRKTSALVDENDELVGMVSVKRHPVCYAELH
jgi:hypothetical protein